ncbi:hypothetical protein ZWY2020_011286 [Hordeum vulgare]|nr:hypothetical protein ZWY2020_011286 [Hordeum vulgare]
MIGSSVPETDISTDIVEPARYVRPVITPSLTRPVFVGFTQGSEEPERSATQETTPVNSDDESSMGDSDSIRSLHGDCLGGLLLAMDPEVLDRTRYQIAIYVAGVTQPTQNPTGGDGAGETSRSPAAVLGDLAAEITRLMATPLTPENQEEINTELAKLREAVAKAHRDAEIESARIETRQAQITAERMRLNTDNWRLERQQRASDTVHQRRHQGRLPHDLNPTRLFDTPRTPWAGAAPGGGPGRPPNPTVQPAEDRISRFRTPQFHFSNPVDNVLAATRHLESLPIQGNTPVEREARNAVEMLKTAVVQNAQFSHSLERLHSTHQASYTRSRPEDQPAVNSGPRHIPQDNPPEQNLPGRDLPNTQDAPAPLVGGGGRVGVPCLALALRNERMPKYFKGPRKVPNYTPDLEPASWIESYEIAMDMLDVNEAVCARYFTMMLEGSARTWLKTYLPTPSRPGPS